MSNSGTDIGNLIKKLDLIENELGLDVGEGELLEAFYEACQTIGKQPFEVIAGSIEESVGPKELRQILNVLKRIINA